MGVFVHIGYPKTGTTWFQNKFFPLVENCNYVKCNISITKIVKPYALSFNPKEIRDYFLSKYGDNIIISIEGLIGTLHNFGLNGYLTKEHAVRIKEIFPEAIIIVFLRCQQDIIASSYYQYISGGGTYSLKTYLNHKLHVELPGITLFSYEFFEYHHTINLYYNLFPTKNINIYLFEEFQENIKLFITMFCAKHGFQIDEEKIDFCIEREKLRIGIKHLTFFANLFTARRMLNKYYLFNIRRWYVVFRRIRMRIQDYRIFGPRPDTLKILGNSNYNFILNYYKKSNGKLVKDYGLTKLAKYNYPL